MNEYRLDKNNVQLKPFLFCDYEKATTAAKSFNIMMLAAGYKTDVCFDCKRQVGIVESFVAHPFHSVEYWVDKEKSFYRAIFAFELTK